MVWLAIHFPDFGLEVATRGAALSGATSSGAASSGAPLPDLPRVLIHNQHVIHCNALAISLGIRPGNSLATAQSLAPDALQHFHWNSAHEQARLTFIAEVLYRFSSDVSLEAPDAIVLEAGRSLKLFGDLGHLIESIQSACTALGHLTTVRAGATPLAALALTRSNADTLPEVALRHLACGLQPAQPGTDKAVNTGQVINRLPNKLIERLGNMGITRLGQILDLPRTELAHRFGRSFATWLDRLTGQAPDPRITILPPETFDESVHLLEPIRDKATLEVPMQHLLNELGQWLIARQLGAEALVWSFSAHTSSHRSGTEGTRPGSTSARACMPVRFTRAQQQPRAFAGISWLKLAETPLPDEVLSIGLKARRLQPWTTQSHNLFPDALLAMPGSADASGENTGDAPVDSSTCIELLDQLSARLGETACVRLEAIDCHVPEEAWHPLPFQTSTQNAAPVQSASRTASRRASGASLRKRTTRPSPPAPPGRRPLWFFSPPRPVNVDELVLLEGPERIQGQWWSYPLCRDYYVAAHRNGAQCWAFVDHSQQWYLHGYFA